MLQTTVRRPRKVAKTFPDVTPVDQSASVDAVSAAAEPLAVDHPKTSKSALILSLLQRAEGASLQQLVDATGWLPHTTRAALTGLKRKGHAVTSDKADGVRIYRVAMAKGAA